MSFSKAEQLLQLATLASSRRQGVTLGSALITTPYCEGSYNANDRPVLLDLQSRTSHHK